MPKKRSYKEAQKATNLLFLFEAIEIFLKSFEETTKSLVAKKKYCNKVYKDRKASI